MRLSLSKEMMMWREREERRLGQAEVEDSTFTLVQVKVLCKICPTAALEDLQALTHS
jgi:hypothetical protein